MHTSRLDLWATGLQLCLGCPKTLTCYSIVSKYNDPEKKMKDQVSCYPSSSSVNNQCEPPLTMTSVSLCFPVRNGKKKKHFLESLN